MSHEASSILDFILPCWSPHRGQAGGRNTGDVLNVFHELEEKGASLRVLEPAIDTGGPMGRMVLTVLGMVAEMELGFIRDRQRAGIDAAKAKGVYKGRPVTFDRARIVALRKEGLGATEIAKAVGWHAGKRQQGAQGRTVELGSLGWLSDRGLCRSGAAGNPNLTLFRLPNEMAPHPPITSRLRGPQRPCDPSNKQHMGCVHLALRLARHGTRMPRLALLGTVGTVSKRYDGGSARLSQLIRWDR
jgi:hypothetical protein